MQQHQNSGRDLKKEVFGWLSMALLIFAFPLAFFLCVFFPIWMGWTFPY